MGGPQGAEAITQVPLQGQVLSKLTWLKCITCNSVFVPL